MVTETKQIEKQLAELQARRESLASDVSDAGRALDDAREGLISGKAKAPQVTTAQSTYTALAEALAALDARILERRARLEEATREEQRAADLARIGEIRRERDSAMGDFNAAIARGNVALSEVVEEMKESIARWQALGEEAAPLLARVWGLQKADLLRHPATTKEYRSEVVAPYGEAVGVAYQIEARRIEREYLKEMLREQSERRRALVA
jgi:multidrug efflux pump subunit AcrA (membrane-fusion protein)